MKLFKRNQEPDVRVAYQLLQQHNGGEIPNHHKWFVPGRIVYDDEVSWILLECENNGCLGAARVKLESITVGVPLGTVLPDPPGTQERYDAEMKKQSEEQA